MPSFKTRCRNNRCSHRLVEFLLYTFSEFLEEFDVLERDNFALLLDHGPEELCPLRPLFAGCAADARGQDGDVDLSRSRINSCLLQSLSVESVRNMYVCKSYYSCSCMFV